MVKRRFKLTEEGGLHLRNAALLVKSAEQYKSKITVCSGCTCADSCSILQLLSLGAGKDSVIEVTAEGPDAEKAIRRVSELFSDGAGI